MTVEITYNREDYLGNGVTLIFPYGFKVFASTDLQVYVDDVLQVGGYTVSGVGSPTGGNVTFTLAPANLAEITIIRVMLIKQSTAYPNAGAFPASAHEAALDKLTMFCQQLSEVDARTLKYSISSVFTDPSLPDPESGKFLRWRGDLTGLENASIVSGGVLGLPVAFIDGGTGAAYADGLAAAKGLSIGLWRQGADIVGSATLALPNPLDGNLIKVTGNVGITALAVTGINIGTRVALWFTGIPLLTHGANFFLRGAANCQVVANDVIEFIYLGTNKWQEISRVNAAAATLTKFMRDDGQMAVPVLTAAQLQAAGGVTVLDRDVAVIDVNTTLAETTVYTFSVPGGTLGTNKMIRLTLIGDYLNNSGGASNLTIRIKYGATTVAVLDRHTGVTASANRRICNVNALLSALNLTNAQVAASELYLSTAIAAALAGEDAEDDLGLGAIRANHVAVAEDSTAAKNLVVTVQHSVSAATISFRAHIVQVELL